jgi:regulator of sigma E protease
MVIILGILTALIVFSTIVFFHELGHFMAARRAGVKVEEFGLGIPPRAMSLRTDSKGTLYTLNWLPIGGFVKLRGEDAIHATDPTSFASKGYWARTMILLGGVVMNFLLAWVILLGLFWSTTNPTGLTPLGVNTKFVTTTQSKLVPTYEQAVVQGLILFKGTLIDPLAGGVAERAGVRLGDRVIAVNGTTIAMPSDFVEAIKKSPTMLDLTIERAGIKSILKVIPENGKIGVSVYADASFQKDFKYSYSFAVAAKVAATEVYSQSRLTLELLGDLIRKIIRPATPTERGEATKSLTGPIGIGNLFVSLVEVKVPISVIFLIAAVISINLGVFNLLPFPALDGGRFAFLTIHTIVSRLSRGKLGTSKIEARANMIGFALLMLMSIFVAYQDIVRIITQ